MRDAYHRRLALLTDQLADLCAQVGRAMEQATEALLTADVELAGRIISGDSQIDAARTACQEHACLLLARQAPVATELRCVVSAMHSARTLERMGDLARHVAETAHRRHPDQVIPEPLRALFADIALNAVLQANTAEQVLRTQDLQLARSVRTADETINSLHRDLLELITADSWPHGVRTAVDLTLLGRFYERFGDHAVSLATRTIYVVTGHPDDDPRRSPGRLGLPAKVA